MSVIVMFMLCLQYGDSKSKVQFLLFQQDCNMPLENFVHLLLSLPKIDIIPVSGEQLRFSKEIEAG